MADETNNPAGATATRSVLENPEKTLATTTQDASAPASENLATAVPPASGCAGEAINGDSKAKEARSERNKPANDIEKKIRRSERFGVPLQLSEQEKRNSRAERFGTVLGSGALNSSEELKRKSRAERFGLEANSNTAVHNEEKKKARLARFGSNTKLDSQEEEKRKARALRFAQSPADSKTYTNCKGTIELASQETAVIGGTTGGI